MKKKFKDAVGNWLPVIEDAIPLSQYMPTPHGDVPTNRG